MDMQFRNVNALGVIAISCVLAYAEYSQLLQHELPCPLCLLQRIGFVAVMFCLLLNVIYGSKAMHYSLATISALFGAAVSLRQISLHVVPGTPGYGTPFLGYHFYTWAFIVFTLIIFAVAVISSISSQYNKVGFHGFKQQSILGKTAIGFCVLMVLLNVLVTFAECGPLVCPDNPEDYWLLQKL